MIRKIQIQNIRGIREGVIDGLTPITVFVGANNSGKSTVLDAILVGASPDLIEGKDQAVIRRQDLVKPNRWFLFNHGGVVATEASVTITADSGVRELRLAYRRDAGNGMPADSLSIYWPTPSQSGQPFSDVPEVRLVDSTSKWRMMPLPELFSRVGERGLLSQVKSIIKELVPEIEDVQILVDDGKTFLGAFYKDGAKPLPLEGEGVQLLVRNSLELAAPAGGVVLMEEPEAHMHPAAIGQLAKAIVLAAGRGIQVVLTTHSLDLIDSLLAESSPDGLDKLSVFRLALDDGQLKTSRFPGKDVAFTRTQIQDDLR